MLRSQKRWKFLAVFIYLLFMISIVYKNQIGKKKKVTSVNKRQKRYKTVAEKSNIKENNSSQTGKKNVLYIPMHNKMLSKEPGRRYIKV